MNVSISLSDRMVAILRSLENDKARLVMSREFSAFCSAEIRIAPNPAEVVPLKAALAILNHRLVTACRSVEAQVEYRIHARGIAALQDHLRRPVANATNGYALSYDPIEGFSVRSGIIVRASKRTYVMRWNDTPGMETTVGREQVYSSPEAAIQATLEELQSEIAHHRTAIHRGESKIGQIVRTFGASYVRYRPPVVPASP